MAFADVSHTCQALMRNVSVHMTTASSDPREQFNLCKFARGYGSSCLAMTCLSFNGCSEQTMCAVQE